MSLALRQGRRESAPDPRRRTHESHPGFLPCARIPPAPPHGLRRRHGGVPLAAAAALQLGHRLVRRIRPQQHPDRAAHRPRRRRQAARGLRDLRRALRAQHPRRELAPWTRRREGRSHPRDAPQHAAPLGAHARRDEARRSDHPRHHAAYPRRPRRPHLPRQRAPRRRRSVGRRKAGRFRRAQDAAAGGRQRARLDPVRRCARREERAALARAHRAGRSASALLHLGHHRAAEAGPAHAAELPGGALLHHVLDWYARRRRAREHQLAGLGQARLEQLLRPLERRRAPSRSCASSRWRRSAARPPSGACWSSRTWERGRRRCASS